MPSFSSVGSMSGDLSGKSGKAGSHLSEQTSFKLCVNRTFLEFESDEEGAELSPRAHSDPGSLMYGSTAADNDFNIDDGSDYANQLSGTMSQIWGAWSCSSDQKDEDEAVTSRMPVADASQNTGGFRGVTIPGTGVFALDGMSQMGPEAPKAPKLSSRELQSHVKHAAREVENRLHQRRKRAVLEAIQEIPEQVGGALQTAAAELVGDVSGEVALVKDIIEGSEPGGHLRRVEIDTAVAKLEVIPEIIHESLEAYFSKAEETVRARVDDMIQSLEQNFESKDLANDKMVEKMWAIPGEVQEIAKQALQAAVFESRLQAQQQIDCAVAHLPNQRGARHLAGMAERRIMPQVAADPTTMTEGARSAVADRVGQAVAVAKEDREMVANQAVAEALLRMKVETVEKRDAEANAVAPPPPPLARPCLNEGSLGHPELCQRPCLFFARGECVNSASCNYCHLDHAKRPVHPDKQNRQLMSDMAFPELLATFLPVIREKLRGLGLAAAEADGELDALATRLLGGEAAAAGAAQQLPGRKGKQLQQFLRAMTMRSLIHLLMRAAPASPQSALLQDFADSLRDVLASRGSR